MADEKAPLQLTITGRLQFKAEITLAQAAQIVGFLDDPSTGQLGFGAETNAKRGRDVAGGGGAATPRDVLDVSGAKTNPERIVALGLHVQQEASKDTFTVDEIRPLFRRAREAVPGNISRDMDNAIKAGWLAEAATKGEFYVTDRAASVLESGFDDLRGKGAGGRGRRTSGGKRGRRSALEVPEVFAGVEEISPAGTGLVDYHKLKTKTDKFLWAVYYAKHTLKVPALSNKELTWLTDRLGECITANDVGGYFRSNHKAGHVNRSMQDQKIRITPTGEAHLTGMSDSTSE